MWDWAVRALGVFWFAGGMVTLRALRLDRTLDGMFAGLGRGFGRHDVVRASLLALGAVLTTLAGLLLAALDRFAPAALVANAVVQAIWLLYAARHFPPEDEEDRVGRMRVRNAFVVWLVGTTAVIAAEWSGALELVAVPVLEVVAVVAAAGAIVWQGLEIDRMRRMPAIGAMSFDAPEPEEDRPFVQPTRILLAPEVGCWPLWDADDGRNLDPWRLDLPEDLRDRIAAFEGRVIDALDVDHDDGPTIVDRDTLRRLEAEAIDLIRPLAAIYGEDAVAWRLPGGA